MSEQDLRAGLERLKRELLILAMSDLVSAAASTTLTVMSDRVAALLKAVPAQAPEPVSLDSFRNVLLASQVDLPADAAKVLRDNLWQLYDESRSPDGDGHAGIPSERQQLDVSRSAEAVNSGAREASTTERAGSEPADSHTTTLGRAVPPAAQSEYEELVSAVLAYSTSPRETWTHRGIVDLADAHAQDSQTMDKIEATREAPVTPHKETT